MMSFVNKNVRYQSPLNEVLAAGIILHSNWNGGMPVLDPMCGSGTTGKACLNLSRKCILNDINNSVVDVVKNRCN